MNIAEATGGMSPDEIALEVRRGGRFVVYQYRVSIIIMSFKRNGPVRFVKVGESAVVQGLALTLLSLAIGWWGIPWGFIYTPQVVYRNLKGGIDVTALVMRQLQGGVTVVAPPPAT